MASSSSTTNKRSTIEIKRITKAGISHPFGDARSVKQAFPSGLSPEESDPFLMCDYFYSMDMDAMAEDEDDFPIGWHPHRGFDIATYMKQGKGRHADSLGNRAEYDSPGLQWMSTGSGVYHAEGGANAKGEPMQGFQIWINVPRTKKMDDPRYGTVQPTELPRATVGSTCRARVLAGQFLEQTGPFTTVQPVQMIDLDLSAASGEVAFEIGREMDTAMLYLYEGSLQSLNGNETMIEEESVVLLDASDKTKRSIVIATTNSKPASVMLFAGKRLNQPIKWHGPIVMTDEYEVAKTFRELRGGFFPPVCVHWNYRRLASKPSRCKVVPNNTESALE